MRETSGWARYAVLVIVTALAALGIAASSAAALTVSLPDGRTYELVSPIANPTIRVNVLPLARVSSDGNAVAFQTWGDRSVGPSDNLETYVSRRSASGWTPKLITPPGLPRPDYDPAFEIASNPFFAFNSDLSQALFDTMPMPNSPLVPGEPGPNSDNLYEQNTANSSYTLLSTAGTGSYVSGANAWASPDLQHVVFDSDDGSIGGGGYYPGIGPEGVFEWSAGQGMSNIGILPGGGILPNAVAGSGNTAPVAEIPNASYVNDYPGVSEHIVSDDGTRVFFTNYGGGGESDIGHLYERRDEGMPDASTVQVDAPAPGAPLTGQNVNGSYSARFIGATSSGHQALFTSCAQLTADSTASGGGIGAGTCSTGDESRATSPNEDYGSASPFHAKNDLYVYDEDANAGAGSLTDISTGDPAGADVLGVLGESSDLSRVYFAARGNLTGTVPSLPGVCNTPGGQQANLYVWDKTDGIRYITTLQEPISGTGCFNDLFGDIPDWETNIDGLHKDAQVSADGRYLAFASESSVIDPSFNNVDADSNLPHQEVYEYDYNANATPTCLSCVGGPPTTDSTLASNELTTQETDTENYPDWQKQNLLSNGTLFFESGEKLVAADDSTTDNVYEYKPSTGTVSLISSGLSDAPSHFLGATANGSDVFFSTDQSLLPSDVDNNYNVWDARVGGGVPNTPPPAPCTPQLCAAPPGTSTFVGPGNPKPGTVVAPPKAVAFALARLTSAQVKSLARGGGVTLSITAPGAGKVSAKALARLGRGAAKTIASASTTARKAGLLHLTLHLSGAARSTLKRAGHLAVTIQASFGRTTKTLHITLIQKRP